MRSVPTRDYSYQLIKTKVIEHPSKVVITEIRKWSYMQQIGCSNSYCYSGSTTTPTIQVDDTI